MTDHDDLLSVLRSAQATTDDSSGYLTMRELCARLPEMSDTMLRARLRELRDAGRLAVAWQVRVNLAGARQRVPCYRLAGE